MAFYKTTNRNNRSLLQAMLNQVLTFEALVMTIQMKGIEKILVCYCLLYTMDLPSEFLDEILELDYSVENCLAVLSFCCLLSLLQAPR